MKQPRKPTRAEKELINKSKLDWHNWMVADVDNISIALISKKSNRRRVIFK